MCDTLRMKITQSLTRALVAQRGPCDLNETRYNSYIAMVALQLESNTAPTGSPIVCIRLSLRSASLNSAPEMQGNVHLRLSGFA